MRMNRTAFFDRMRGPLFGGRLPPVAVDGLTHLLDTWEREYAALDRRWLAYALATAHHETGRTMQPVREVGRGKGKRYGVRDPETKRTYYGRGVVQLTWRRNYQVMSDRVGHDLVRNPDLALLPAVSARILFEGMIYGLFTGKRFADYFMGSREEWGQARRIINGMDRAETIAGYGRLYDAALATALGVDV